MQTLDPTCVHVYIISTTRYCDAGTVTPPDCPVGMYCLVNTTSASQYPCPTGTYNNGTGLQMESQCIQCNGGTYCETTG